MNAKTVKIYFDLGYFRILHAAPDIPSVDIYINDKLVSENLSYSNYTAYLPIFQESYQLSIYQTGSNDSPILSHDLIIDAGNKLTLAIIKTQDNLGFMEIPDAYMPINPSKSMIRFVHLSPNAPAVDITLEDGTILFSGISYMQATSYLEVNPSNYTLQVRVSGTPNVVLTVPNINLEPDNFYTVYALGLVGEEPELEALLLLDSFK